MEKRIDCIIAVPTFLDKNKKHIFSNLEMLGPEYIVSSLLYHGFSAKLFNAYSNDISQEEIIEEIKILNPKVIGITCASQRSYPSVIEFVKQIKTLEWNGTIIVGGFYATLEAERILRENSEIDFISLGEGEYSFPNLVSAVINGKPICGLDGIGYRENEEIKINEPKRIENLDFPFLPYRFPITKNAVSNMVDGKYIPRIYYNISAGRGCYGRCSFCSINAYEGIRKRIYRSPSKVVDEMEFLKNEFGTTHIWFNDEIFYERSIRGRTWLQEFCVELRQRNLGMTFNIELRPNDVNLEELQMLKSVGLTAIFIGIESGIQRILDEMRKDTTVDINKRALSILSKLDIKIEMGWIALVPTMTFEELEANYDFLFSTECYTEENIYNRFNLYPGCYYEKILNEMNLLNPDSPFYDRFGYDFVDKKVRIFTELVDYLRSEFGPVKEKTMYVQEKVAIHGDYTEYLRIRSLQKKLWRNLIPELLALVKAQKIWDADSLRHTELYSWFKNQLEQIQNSIVEV